MSLHNFFYLPLMLSVLMAQTADTHRLFIEDVFEETLTTQGTYKLLKKLCKNYPHRLSGSEGLEAAVQWSKTLLQDSGFERVYLQDVMVPHWERGEKESATYFNNKGKKEQLSVLALGRSVSTPETGITAEVVRVNSLLEIAKIGKKGIAGRIVFINQPFAQHFIRTFEGYSETVEIRSKGPSESAKYGALACVIRSVGTADDDYAHTGALRYENNIEQIPAAALGVKSAEKLSRALKVNPKIKLTLKINSQTFPDKLSHNVIGEITGTENPKKIITLGGHLDAWDVGEGAHDDGAGCMQSVMAVKTLLKLGYKPRNTIRVVLFTNEENGLKGGLTYAEMAKQNNEQLIFAIESDAGGFSPRSIGIKAPDSLIQKVSVWTRYFPEYTIDTIMQGGAPADLGKLNSQTGTPVANLIPDSQRYFDFHHSNADVFEAVNARELELGTASLASFVYLIDQSGL